MRTMPQGRRIVEFGIVAAALLVQGWWFLTPDETWAPLLAGPLLVSGAYNARRDEEKSPDQR